MMANETRLIDANEISYHKSGFPKGDGFDSGLDWVFREDIDKLPTVDAVEVVRCKDCLYRSQYSDENGMYHCGGIDTTKDHALPVVSPDFFCAHGERRAYENC